MRNRAYGLIVGCVAAAALASVALAAPGKLDRSFSGDGWRTTDFAGHSDRGLDVAVQDDGRIIVAGSTRLRGAEPDFALARYRRNGKSDRSFSSDGILHTGLNDGDEVATSVAIQPNGRIVAAGVTGFRDEDFGVVRYLRNGRLDDSFGGDGRVATDLQRTDEAADVAIAPRSDRIVVAGTSERSAANQAFAVAVHSRRGKLLRKFTSEGNESVELGTATAVAARPSGKILVAGSTDRSDGHDTFAVARFTGTGELDASFGEAGIATFDVPARNDEFLTAMGVRNGRILLGGWTANGDGPADMALARLDRNGDPDTTFSSDGWTTINFDRDDLLFGLSVERDGKAVLVGDTRRGAAIARLRKNGALDRSFSGDGKAVPSGLGGSGRFEGVALQGGKIVAAGFSSFDDRSDFLVARFRG